MYSKMIEKKENQNAKNQNWNRWLWKLRKRS